MDQPRLYYERQVCERLKLWKRDFEKVLELGLIAPVGRDPASGTPLFCAETIDRLATKEQRERLRDALWWDFAPHPDRKDRRGKRWLPPVDLPYYPFDSEGQQEWARKLHRVMKKCAPFPHPNPTLLENFKKRTEDKATKAFQRAHGLARRRRQAIFVRGRRIEVTRGELRDLVWSKTMIRAAADLDMSEFKLRGICKRWLVPTPPRGHFNHKDPKARAPRPTLSAFREKSKNQVPPVAQRHCSPTVTGIHP